MMVNWDVWGVGTGDCGLGLELGLGLGLGRWLNCDEEEEEEEEEEGEEEEEEMNRSGLICAWPRLALEDLASTRRLSLPHQGIGSPQHLATATRHCHSLHAAAPGERASFLTIQAQVWVASLISPMHGYQSL
ncbi:hypothetical protein E2C01_000715 [Portunus trituberculatus]|uniref:Uncharacterized protein n=1 Tax=Portunus trituberculatus TaxID=210409 RepID=A0A5B7CF40_PORTR|nr:hypothetical protein [Portunus trituberculatus]